MKIAVENNLSVILQMTPEEEDWIFNYLSIHEPQFRKNYQTGRMEFTRTNQRYLIHRKHLTFPSGFVRVLWSKAKREDPPIEIQIEDRRVRPAVELAAVDLSYLRYYQTEAVQVALDRKRGILHHVTGAGKTVVAVALVQSVPLQWLFLVRSKDLLYQAANKYEELTGEKANLIGDGKCEVSAGNHFTVATVQSLHAKRAEGDIWGMVRSAEGLIIDEAHATPANTLYQLAVAAERAYYRIGLSGTPLSRTDQKSLMTIGALGPVIHRVKADELIEAGYLSKSIIKMYGCEQDSARNTWQGVYGELIVRSAKRNALVVKLMQAAEKPNLTFIKEVKHGKALVSRAEKAGLRVGFVWGNKKTPERDKAISQLVRGDLDCIIASVVFQEGIDIPDLRSVIVATSGKSAIATLQRIGRGMRVTPDKNSFEVFDILDTGHRWTEKHARARANAYRKEGHDVETIKED
jgi:superfamily II DNA or RNA helicase